MTLVDSDDEQSMTFIIGKKESGKFKKRKRRVTKTNRVVVQQSNWSRQ